MRINTIYGVYSKKEDGHRLILVEEAENEGVTRMELFGFGPSDWTYKIAQTLQLYTKEQFYVQLISKSDFEKRFKGFQQVKSVLGE